MTPTERLRELLDEREIAWRSIANDDCATEYTHGGVLYRAYETYGGLQVAIVTPMTPEQVIAATLPESDAGGVFDSERYSKVCRLLEDALTTMSEWGTSSD